MIVELIKPPTKTWAHDRRDTIGASEIGKCARNIWWTKFDPLPEQGRWGPMERGNMIEAWVYDRLRDAGLEVAETQRTLVSGYLSATVDALVGDVAVEIKSFVDGGRDFPGKRKLPLHAHTMQVQVQVGLWNAVGGHPVNGGLLLYVNAADLQDMREFPVERDPDAYAASVERARRIMSETDPLALLPEGKIAGAQECSWCQYQQRCK